MHETNTAKAKLIASMTIFGTIGLFVRLIPLPSAAIAAARGAVGAAFLLLVTRLRGTGLSAAAVRRHLPKLALSGGLMGFNWILLFESYRYTTVAVATLCYYMAPILVVAASPFLFGERITLRRVLCVLAALAGMVCVSGVGVAGLPAAGELRGVLLALGAAVLYAAVVTMNKTLRDVAAYERTVVQLATASAVVLPYCFATGAFAGAAPGTRGLILLAVVCVVHTGVAYSLYFGCVERLPAQTLALFSYIDPVVAVLLSALVLREPLGPPEIAGAALILGAAVVSELPEKQKKADG